MKVFKCLLPLVLIIALSTCSGPEGESYLAFSWVSAPLYFYDENPSTPAFLSSGSYFHSNTGTYYMEYTAWDSSSWWMYYTISAESGKPFFQKGSDAYFQVLLYSSGPSIWKWSYPAILQEPGANHNRETVNATVNRTTTPHSFQKGSVQNRDSHSIGGYRIEIEYGRLQ